MPEQSLPPNVRDIYQDMWANNGDAISRQYAGTAAMKVTSRFNVRVETIFDFAFKITNRLILLQRQKIMFSDESKYQRYKINKLQSWRKCWDST